MLKLKVKVEFKKFEFDRPLTITLALVKYILLLGFDGVMSLVGCILFSTAFVVLGIVLGILVLFWKTWNVGVSILSDLELRHVPSKSEPKKGKKKSTWRRFVKLVLGNEKLVSIFENTFMIVYVKAVYCDSENKSVEEVTKLMLSMTQSEENSVKVVTDQEKESVEEVTEVTDPENEIVDEVMKLMLTGLKNSRQIQVIEEKSVEDVTEPEKESVEDVTEVTDPKKEIVDEVMKLMLTGLKNSGQSVEDVTEVTDPEKELVDEILKLMLNMTQIEEKSVKEVTEPEKESVEDVTEPEKESVEEKTEPEKESVEEKTEPENDPSTFIPSLHIHLHYPPKDSVKEVTDVTEPEKDSVEEVTGVTEPEKESEEIENLWLMLSREMNSAMNQSTPSMIEQDSEEGDNAFRKRDFSEDEEIEMGL